jgi:pimeloyl-ACP methyl ester carboxylesterase
VAETVLVIPGLNGAPGLLMSAAPSLFPPGWSIQAHDHHDDLALDGVPGIAQRALHAVDAQRIWLCGESFGGTVALTAAHLAPERVKGLMLLSTFGWHPSTLARRGQPALAIWSFLGARVPDSVYRAGRLASVMSQLGPRLDHALLARYMRHPRANVIAYRRKAELSLSFDARPWLPSVEAPAFVLVGRWDPVVPPSAGKELARLLPRATLHTLPGGHLVHLVQTDRVGALLGDWLAGLG